MHEGGLCEGVLAVVLDAASGRQVRKVSLRIGRLQRVAGDSFDFYWEMLSAGTPAEGASVDVVETPIRIRCRGCGGEQQLDDVTLLCPACDGADLELLAGNGVAVEAIELEGGEVVRNPELAEVREDHEQHP